MNFRQDYFLVKVKMGNSFISVLFIMVIFCHQILSQSNPLLRRDNAQIPADCSMKAQCQPLENNKCFGTVLPYTHTSLQLANDSNSQRKVQENLLLWSALKNVPRCWDVIQPLLCSVYMPQCNATSGTIDLPSQEMCDITRGPCKVVETFRGWPDFLQCNQTHFKKGCLNEAKQLEFNTSGTCEYPLVATSNRHSWYKDIEGCGIQCQNPLFTDAEHQQVHIFIGVLGTVCLLCTLLAVLTFLIDWKNASRYPALILFFINSCFFVGSIGWLAQFSPGARQDIVCKSDGTVRKSEPQIGSGETASCAIVFILVYYAMMAGVTWFVILTYAWHLTFKALGTPRDAVEGKKGHFHLVAWSFPLVLTIVCLALTEIDGDSVSGICFVGNLNHVIRGVFVLLPVGVVLVIGLFFLGRGLVTLIVLKKDAPNFISDKATAKIRETILRIGIFASLALVFVVMTFSVHFYIFANEEHWMKSFQDFVICEANVTVAKSLTNNTAQCVLKSRPNLLAIEIHIFAFFGAGIAMSSWVWNKASVDAWQRFFRKVFRLPNNKPVKLKKHKMIAQAFNKRREIGQGRLSISFHSTHDDPLGMKFDLNSVSSMEMSSAWAAAIPRMVLRRGGMIHPTAGTLRRYSDSDVQSIKSFNRRMSQELESKISALNVPTEKSTKGTPGTNQPAMEGEPTKKRKRKKKKRGKNKVTPVTAFTAPDGGAQVGGPRRPSAVSVDSNASAHSIHLSMERPGSTDTGSDRGVEPTGNPGQHPTELTTNLPPQFTAVNHMTSYSMFTASSFLPGMIELTDLDNPAPEMHQTPKTVPSSGNKSNSNHTYSNPIATDLTDEIVDVDEVIEIGDQSEYSVDSI